MENQTLFEEKSEEKGILDKFKVNEQVFNLIFFLVLGVLLGIGIKTEAVKRVTIGFNDYKIKSTGEMYDIGKVQERLNEEAQQEEENANNEEGSAATQPPGGATCN